MPGGSTCWNGDRTRRMPPRSTSIGTCCRTAPAAACCCRSSARPMARRSRAARSNSATTRTKAASPPGISSIGCRSRRTATARFCATIVTAAGADDSAAGQRLLALAARSTRTAQSRRARKRPAFKRELAAIAGGASRHRARAGRLSRRARIGRRRCWRCITCWSASTTGSAHWRLASSDINYRRFFDINTLAGLRVEDAGTFERDPRAGAAADRGRPAAGPADRSHRRPARSRAIFPAAAPPDPRRAGRARRAVLSS